MPDRHRIFYNSVGTPDMYALIEQEMPKGYELVTLTSESDAERLERIGDCEVAIVAARPLTAAAIAAGGRLRLVHHQGVGYHDTVDVAALAARGIRLALTPEGTTIGVAEHTLLLALAACRRLPQADAALRQGEWLVNALRPVSLELYGKSVGFLGFGRIGREAALRFQAFGTRGYYYDPQVDLDEGEARGLGVERAEVDWILGHCDIVSLHMPLTAGTRHILDRARLGRLKRGAVVINTARGGLVDDLALAEGLAAGRIGAAGLDVFETEPLPGDHPLCRLDNVVLTPHISAGTRDAMAHKMQALFANVERFFRGEPLHNEVELQPGAERRA